MDQSRHHLEISPALFYCELAAILLGYSLCGVVVAHKLLKLGLAAEDRQICHAERSEIAANFCSIGADAGEIANWLGWA